MTAPIRGLGHDDVARLYDALHLAYAAAQQDYWDATDLAPEEYARGRRDGIDEALSILDEFVDGVPA